MYLRPLVLDRLVQPVGVFQGAPDGGYGTGNVLTVLEHFDTVAGMAGSVGRDEDGLDVVIFDHFFERGIGLLAPAGLGQVGAAVGKEVTDGNHVNVGMILEAEGGAKAACSVSDDADTNLAIGDGLPGLGSIGIYGSLFEALDLGGRLGRGGSSDPHSCSAEAYCLEKRAT